jgi:hypothetical protein
MNTPFYSPQVLVKQDSFDSDSSTSTPSINSDQDIDNFIPSLNAINQLKLRLIKPINSFEFIHPSNLSVINDSFELSLCRFIHLVFSSNGLINRSNIIKYIDDSACAQDFYDYWVNNPGVMFDSEFYTGPTGINIRSSWFELLHSHSFSFSLNENGSIIPSVENIFNFFNGVFPKLLNDLETETNIQTKLSWMFTRLNFNFDQFYPIYAKYQSIEANTIHSSSIINIYINQIELFVWEMTNVKIIDSSNTTIEIFSNSEFRYSS